MNKYIQDLLIVDSQDFAQGFGFASTGKLFLIPESCRKSTRWDFTRAVTQGWCDDDTITMIKRSRVASAVGKNYKLRTAKLSELEDPSLTKQFL